MAVPATSSWYVVRGDLLRDLLARAAAGEDPELLMLELYANSDVDRYEGDPNG